MKSLKNISGKIILYLLVTLILIGAALGVGYFISLVRFDQKYSDLNDRFDKFEGKYEMMISTLESDLKTMQAYIKEKEGKAEEEAKNLRLMSLLLKAKGEIISSKLTLSREEVSKSMKNLDASISVLGDAYDMAEGELREKIEDIRLRLATVKGIIEVNSFKAQEELDKLWREVDTLTGK